jgi:uncharacterized membrane protein (UPF0127 family)
VRWAKAGALFVLLAVLLIGARSVGNLNCGGHLRHDKTVMVNGHTIYVQTAVSEAEHNKGLSGLPCISKNEGMLFVFDQSDYYRFWMKDTNFALDFVWLDGDKHIVTQVRGVDPSTYPREYVSDQPAKYVLELPAGQIAKLGLANGSQILF